MQLKFRPDPYFITDRSFQEKLVSFPFVSWTPTINHGWTGALRSGQSFECSDKTLDYVPTTSPVFMSLGFGLFEHSLSEFEQIVSAPQMTVRRDSHIGSADGIVIPFWCTIFWLARRKRIEFWLAKFEPDSRLLPDSPGHLAFHPDIRLQQSCTICHVLNIVVVVVNTENKCMFAMTE
jgi:hypothetical protein